MTFPRIRSLLFVPAVRPDFIEKLPARGADAAVIDCEDATPPAAKAEARANVRSLAPGVAAEGCAVFVRVNGPGSAWFGEDMRDALCPELTGVVVPKLDREEQLAEIDRALERAGLPDIPIIAGIETARGIANARPILAHPRVAAAYFGAEDFVADMGGVRTPGGQEVLYARSEVVLAGRLADTPAIDQAVIDFRDDAAFGREIEESRALGYQGKICVHPRQVALANRGFLPGPDEIAAAERLLAAYERARVQGVAAIAFEGRMIDEPLAARARQVLAAATAEERE